MQKDFEPASNICAAASVTNYHIINKFSLKNSDFLVVYVEAPVANNQQLPSSVIIDLISFPVVGHFEFNGDSYLVVNTQKPLTNINDNLINLLTERELQITVLVALGWANKKVAKQLQISDLTVSAHLRRIYTKLKVDSRSAMAYRCASLINHLQELCSIQGQASLDSPSEKGAKSTTDEKTLQYDIAGIDRLLRSVLSVSSIMSE